MSVALASRTTPQNVLADYPDHSLVSFSVDLVRQLGCIVTREEGDPDPAHALVCHNNPESRLTKSQAKSIANKAQWEVYKPPDS